MPVQFVLGRAGTGKTEHCFNVIEQWVAAHGLSSKVFFLLPQQATFIAERQLVARKPGRSLLGVRVVSFEMLLREVAPANVVQAAAVAGESRRLLIAMAIQQRAGELTYFKGADQQPHLAARIDGALTEIDESGHTLEQLAGTVGEAGPAQAKLADLRIIRDAYANLAPEQVDSFAAHRRLLGAISASALLKDALVVVDGFAGFSKVQRETLVAIAGRAARTDIALLLDAVPHGQLDELGLFYRTAKTYQQLVADLQAKSIPATTVCLRPIAHRLRPLAMQAVEQHFGEAVAKPLTQDAAGVQLAEHASELEEVRFAARQIRRWQMQGIRLREIGVLCRSLADYSHWIAPVFAEHDIPCFVDQRRTLAHHPLLRLTRCVLEIAAGSLKQGTVLEMLKCGLMPLSDHQADAMENFVLRHGITGAGWEKNWDALVTAPAGEDEQPDCQREREEAARCAQWRDDCFALLKSVRTSALGERPVAEYVAALRDLVAGPDSHVRQAIDRWIVQGSPEQAQEHDQCRAKLLELLEMTERLLGGQRLTLPQFSAMLQASMENMEAKLTPPTLDQVLVGQIDRSRSPEFRCVIVLGMNEGTFPAAFTEDSIFSDTERQHLERSGIELRPDSRRKALDEQLMAYVALTRASEHLVLSRPVADEDGRPRERSGILAQVESIIGPQPSLDEGSGKLDEVATPGQLAGLLASWRRDPADVDDPRLAAIWSSAARASAFVQKGLDLAQAALAYKNQPKLSPEIVEQLLKGQLQCSVTRLEHYAACPFRHFAGDVLKLKEREIAELSSLDLGNAFHMVLDELGKRIARKELDWQSASDQLDGMLDDVARQLRGELLLSSSRNQYVVGVIRRMLERIVRDQEALEKAGSYRVHATELSFGLPVDGSLPPFKLQTPKGREVVLRGRIDRVDRTVIDGQESFLVFDYKTREKKLSLAELNFGLTLQLLTYVMVLRANQMKADGAMYIALMRKLKSERLPPADEDGPVIQSKPRGIFSREALEGMEPGLSGQSELYSVRVNNDGTLGASGDGVEPKELDELLDGLKGILGEMADAIFDGQIDIHPYQLGTASPCSYCEFRPVCRMDVAHNRYRILKAARKAKADDDQPVPPVTVNSAKGAKSHG